MTPSTRSVNTKEDWLYSPTQTLGKFHSVTSALSSTLPVFMPKMPATKMTHVVCVNGRLDAALSSKVLPQGLVVEMRHGGLHIELAAQVTLVDPLALVLIEAPNAANDRLSLKVEVQLHQASFLQLVEMRSSASDEPCLVESHFEINLGERAKLVHHHLTGEHEDTTHLSKAHIKVQQDASYVMNSLSQASTWTRQDLQIDLRESGAACALMGLDLARNEQHFDRHLNVRHLAPNTRSEQLFKSVLDDQASGSFFGKICVEKGADGTLAQQNHKSLLLSDRAEVNTRPQLEILTDEVSCTHGATVGALDSDALFFLRSRGLSESVAKQMLLMAFVKEQLHTIEHEALRVFFEAFAQGWFAHEAQ